MTGCAQHSNLAMIYYPWGQQQGGRHRNNFRLKGFQLIFFKIKNQLGALRVIKWYCTVEFWGSIIGQEIFAQNCGFIIGKVVKIMISEG